VYSGAMDSTTAQYYTVQYCVLLLQYSE
jgi:hypothetical protein